MVRAEHRAMGPWGHGARAEHRDMGSVGIQRSDCQSSRGGGGGPWAGQGASQTSGASEEMISCHVHQLWRDILAAGESATWPPMRSARRAEANARPKKKPDEGPTEAMLVWTAGRYRGAYVLT